MPIPTVDQFLADFPEFGDQAVYRPVDVQFYLNSADVMMTSRWDDTYTGRGSTNTKTMLYLGAELYVAHYLAISGRDKAAARKGGGPGIAAATGVGAVSAKSVDEVSLSYDVQATTIPGAGHWNLTTYGIRFYQMARMVGSGGLQVGFQAGIFDPMIPVPQGPAWVGPWVDLGWGWD